MKKVKLLKGDCVERMTELESGSVALVLCDPPYGVTAKRALHADGAAADWNNNGVEWTKWWDEVKRVVKPSGMVVIMAVQPFTTEVINSNPKDFKYGWVWIKSAPSGALYAKKRPMQKHNDLLVFRNGAKGGHYQPPDLVRVDRVTKRETERSANYGKPPQNASGTFVTEFTGWPSTVLEFKVERGPHPTTKPVALCEFLIKCYTVEKEVVLDPFVGSGTTCVAALRTKRKSVGIEMDDHWFDVARKRIAEEVS